MTRAVLSIGSNLGDREANLRIAVEVLWDWLRAISPVYETKPWGVEDQPDFLNAVLIVDDPAADEWTWLHRAQSAEHHAGRVRTRHWGPRTLDVDIVTVDGVTSDHPDLRLPHPGAHERATVLAPWLDIEPHAGLPGHGLVRELLAGTDTSGLRKRDDLRLVGTA
ncbi:MAG TPA: 2-amino-4-hydroxy-6-hydroxymethyldihydropteridine diphosphokinase [Actinophytocola sp.]|uniref:2-amino-4-hydroxy-6- hydroxymethyldihydropteridine diphosphokinase n=1 Tax=Actinophytocola sp. TaxID=1872138 RepID=UPI002DDD26ED|nr:2-amino-4-hydroxy-6-hydroxymethyldihydropteridine diphosphokinase [Actinophytocola sp.]HEV2781417.1 2-amino-4-hydroxy-6-hydroxymethyldihydropteridine diphosphokinase [Actinophytocola sp.]